MSGSCPFATEIGTKEAFNRNTQHYSPTTYLYVEEGQTLLLGSSQKAKIVFSIDFAAKKIIDIGMSSIPVYPLSIKFAINRVDNEYTHVPEFWETIKHISNNNLKQNTFEGVAVKTKQTWNSQ